MQLLYDIRKMVESDWCDSNRFALNGFCLRVLYNYWKEETLNPMELHLIANLFLVILEKSPEEDQIKLISTVLEKLRPESIHFLVAST